MPECPVDWECSICWTGQDDRAIVVHDCKKHWFHECCLKAQMAYSSKCSMCQLKLNIHKGIMPKELIRKATLRSL